MDLVIGSEAIASGALTRGQLRWRYTAIHPNVHIARGERRTLRIRTTAAWLWTGRTGIVAGEAAAAMIGVRGIPDWTPVEIIAKHTRRQRGVTVREERIDDDEVRAMGDMRLTSVARTALDLGRRLPRNLAVEYLDQLAGAGLERAEVDELLDRYRGARGIPRARAALALMDGATRCREETRIRLLLRDAGLPTPRTRILLTDGTQVTSIGMGWDRAKVGISFVAERTLSGSLLVQDSRHQQIIQRQGWLEFSVASLLHGTTLLPHIRNELRRRSR